jgi:hypothetical protein
MVGPMLNFVSNIFFSYSETVTTCIGNRQLPIKIILDERSCLKNVAPKPWTKGILSPGTNSTITPAL